MLKHVLRWLDDTAFNESAQKHPVLTRYLLRAGCVDRATAVAVEMRRIDCLFCIIARDNTKFAVRTEQRPAVCVTIKGQS